MRDGCEEALAIGMETEAANGKLGDVIGIVKRRRHGSEVAENWSRSRARRPLMRCCSPGHHLCPLGSVTSRSSNLQLRLWTFGSPILIQRGCPRRFTRIMCGPSTLSWRSQQTEWHSAGRRHRAVVARGYPQLSSEHGGSVPSTMPRRPTIGNEKRTWGLPPQSEFPTGSR